MATQKIFGVYDVKASLYYPPFFKNTVAEAIRDFTDLANDVNTVVGRHPGDFKLVCFGTFDNVYGLFEPGQIDSLGFASDFRALKPGDVPIGIVKGA